jgi:hypothetical protein
VLIEKIRGLLKLWALTVKGPAENENPPVKAIPRIIPMNTRNINSTRHTRNLFILHANALILCDKTLNVSLLSRKYG